MTRRPSRSAPASARIFRRAGSSRPKFRSSPRRRRSMPPSASSCFRICWPREESGLNPGAPPSIRIPPALLDRLVETALRCPNANIEIAGPYRRRRRGGLQPGAVGKARAGGDRLSGQSRTARRPLHGGRLWQHAAGRRQRYRRRQGAEPPHRFRGEVSDGISGDIPLGLAAGVAAARSGDGLDRGGSSRPGRLEDRRRAGSRCWRRRWSRRRSRA